MRTSNANSDNIWVKAVKGFLNSLLRPKVGAGGKQDHAILALNIMGL